MLKKNVKTGTTYWVKVSSTMARVQLTREHDRGGWFGTNLATGREIRIRTAARLRGEVTPTGENRLGQIRNQRLQGINHDEARQIVDKIAF